MKGLFIIFKKELLEIFRNKGTLAILLLPVFIFPILNLGLSYISKDIETTIRVTLNSENESFTALFNEFSYKGTSQKIVLINTDNSISAVKNGFADCYISEKNNEILFVYNPYSYNSISSATKLSEEFEKFYHLTNNNKDNYTFTLQDNHGNETNIALTVSNIIIPILLISIVLKGASGFAADLFAGERERKTLELLLLSGIDKHKIYFGKLSALLILSLSSALLSISSCLLSYRNSFNLFGFMQNGNIALNIFAITSALISLTVLFSIIYTTTSLFSKSVRNTHFLNDLFAFIPTGIVILLAITPIQTNNFALYFVPIVNLTLCFCSGFTGDISALNIFSALLSNAIFMILLIYIGIKYMRTEKFVR